MATRTRVRFIHSVIAWLLGTSLLFVLLDALAYDLFFATSLIGLLIITHLTSPVNASPHWRRRLRWLIAAGLVAFGYLVVRRILEVLPPGVI